MPKCTSSEASTSLKLSSPQNNAVDFITTGDWSFLVATTGAGKTAICLHAIKFYLGADIITQAIVAAPASVISHWPREAEKWQTGLDVKALSGSPAQRTAILNTHPQVLVVSLNNLTWLLEQNPPAEMIVVDELSKAAGKQTAKLRNKKWKNQLAIRVGMTATPVSESFESLYSMVRVIDSGATFGRSKEGYMTQYFYPTDYKGYNHALNPGAAELILAEIADMTHVIASDKAISLPPIHHRELQFQLPTDTRLAYDQLKKDMLLGDVVAANLAVLSGKLRQVASGFAIDEDESVIDFDNERAYQARRWVLDLNGAKGVILYQYNHQRVQLEAILSNEDTVSVYGGCDKDAALTEFYDDAQILIAQQATLSHGVDGLQHVCADMLFFQPCWSKDTQEQAEGRLHRTGQTKPVTVTTLICTSTIDSLVIDRLDFKGEHMTEFLKHLKD